MPSTEHRFNSIESGAGPHDTRSRIQATHAHISLIAHITPEEFSRILPVIRRAGGYETRLLHGLVNRQGHVDPFRPPHIDRTVLVERLRQAIEFSRESVLTRTDPISKVLCMERGVQPKVTMPLAVEVEVSRETLDALLPAVDADYAYLVKRAPILVMRIALCYAIADAAQEVTMEHLTAALALWEFCARSAERIYSIPTGSLPARVDPRRQGLLFDYLCRDGDWVSRAEIVATVFHGNVSKVEVDEVIDSLVGQRLVEQRTVTATGGRPRTEYRAI
jgi:hypothetical protein